ncbi:competence protein ComJ [Phyllobacterium sp. SB3]|uniref:competence protein ComJ n=1 Tax=Phyllobacterium sp. SB3 TaxID=3156073 RepID=UPI0032AE8D61
MTERFPLTISYAQIAVFDPDLENPFNDWNDRQYTQGFSWREGSVSFAVPDGDTAFVEVLTENERSELSGEPSRVILVPFEIPQNQVVIASIMDERPTVLGAGKYQLTFELLEGGVQGGETYEKLVRLTFVKSDAPVFEIKVADAEMNVDLPLDKNAAPAK